MEETVFKMCVKTLQGRQCRNSPGPGGALGDPVGDPKGRDLGVKPGGRGKLMTWGTPGPGFPNSEGFKLGAPLAYGGPNWLVVYKLTGSIACGSP